MYDNETRNETTVSRKSQFNVLGIVKIILLVCLACFFLPFVTVSCDNMEIVTMTGIKTAIGTEVSGETVPANIFIALSVLATVGALVCSFVRKDKKLITTLSIIAFICLILFVFTFNVYYDVNENSGYEVVDVEYHFALWAEMLLHIGIAVLLNCCGEHISVRVPDNLSDNLQNLKATMEKYMSTLTDRNEVKGKVVKSVKKISTEVFPSDKPNKTSKSASDRFKMGGDL